MVDDLGYPLDMTDDELLASVHGWAVKSVGASLMRSRIAKLEAQGLVKQDQNYYFLTNEGRNKRDG